MKAVSLRWIVVLWVVLSCIGAGCSAEPDESTPEGTLILFLHALDRSAYEHAALEEAYRYLSERAKRRLIERARMATALGAREFQPWEMLVEGRTSVLYVPRISEIEVERSGSSATLRVGEGGTRLAATRERGGWKLDLELPPAR